MKAFLLHHTPKTAHQDTWAVSFSLPYIASQYARASDGVWYVKTWLTADQIAKRLAILFDDVNELRIHELGRGDASRNSQLHWMTGRLEDEEQGEFLNAPRVMWEALQNAAQAFVFSKTAPAALSATAATTRNLRAA